MGENKKEFSVWVEVEEYDPDSDEYTSYFQTELGCADSLEKAYTIQQSLVKIDTLRETAGGIEEELLKGRCNLTDINEQSEKMRLMDALRIVADYLEEGT